MVKITVPTESFFNFFSPPQPPTDDDDTVATDIEERLELDYQLGEDIKEKLIPRAIDWFTGEALQFEELGDDMDGDEFEDEDDEDEDEDEDEDGDNERDVDDDSDEEVCSHFLPFQLLPLVLPWMLISSRMALPNRRKKPQNANKTETRQTGYASKGNILLLSVETSRGYFVAHSSLGLLPDTGILLPYFPLLCFNCLIRSP